MIIFGYVLMECLKVAILHNSKTQLSFLVVNVIILISKRINLITQIKPASTLKGN